MNATQQELDSLGHLEERITRAVELVTSLRAEKSALESQLASAIAERDSVRQELDDLRSERKAGADADRKAAGADGFAERRVKRPTRPECLCRSSLTLRGFPSRRPDAQRAIGARLARFRQKMTS